MGDIQIRVITELAQVESLADVWNELLEKCSGENSIYLTHEWLSTWCKHFGDRQTIYFLLFEKERRVIGIVPLTRNAYRLGFVRVEAFESIRTSCNYVALMLPEHRKEVVSAFLNFMKENILVKKAVLRLSLVPEDSQFLGILRENIAAFSGCLSFRERVKTLAPYVELPETWEEYFRWMGSNRRSVLKRASNALTRDKGIAELLICNADSLEDGLNSFFDIHQERWESVGTRGAFAESRTKEFYREVAKKLLARNWLNLSYLTVNNEVVSAKFGCILRRKYYAMTCARNIRYSKYSVGNIHEMYLIKEAINKKLREYDFLQGDEPYKFYWTRSVRRYMQVVIIKRGFLPGLRMKVTYLFLRLCEVKEYSLKELYALYRIRRREKQELQRMGISEKLDKLKSI